MEAVSQLEELELAEEEQALEIASSQACSVLCSQASPQPWPQPCIALSVNSAQHSPD